MITFNCWGCGKSLKVNESAAGKQCKCTACKRLNTIPALEVSQPVDEVVQMAVVKDFEFDDLPVRNISKKVPRPAIIEPVVLKKSAEKAIEPGKVFCFKCGESIFAEAEICPKCGVRQRQLTPVASGGPNRVVACLLALFLGLLGVHKFYLGRMGEGVIYLLATMISFMLIFPVFIIALLSLIDGISYISYSDAEFSAKYASR